MRFKQFLFLCFFPFTAIFAQEKTFECADLLWTRENAVIKTFRNGEPIPFAKDSIAFEKAGANKQPAWRHINYDPKNESALGIEYNHFVITDPRGFAPEGWRVPSKDEFVDLVEFQGGTQKAGSFVIKKTKDDCGFSAAFIKLGEDEVKSGGAFWTTQMDGIDSFWFFYVDGTYFSKHSFTPEYGLSIRFVKNAGYSQNKVPIKIGNQIWDSKNLSVTQFKNGDPIKFCATGSEWEKACKNKEAAYCYFKFNKERSEKHGLIYNYYALTDKRGLAPKNYHIPKLEDWNQLTSELKGDSPTYCAGKKMKDPNEWKRKNYCEDVSLEQNNFGAIPSGYLGSLGYTENYSSAAYFWIAGNLNESPKVFHLSAGYDHFHISDFYIGNGAQVRCMMDEEYYKLTLPITTIKSSGFEIMDKNLDLAFYRNGDSIPQAKNMEEWMALDQAKIGAWCYADFKKENGDKHGRLYNGHAIRDPRNVAPSGWKIPNKKEYDELIKDTIVIQSLKKQAAAVFTTYRKFELDRTQWWYLQTGKAKRYFYLTIKPETITTELWSTASYTGCYIRCIKE